MKVPLLDIRDSYEECHSRLQNFQTDDRETSHTKKFEKATASSENFAEKLSTSRDDANVASQNLKPPSVLHQTSEPVKENDATVITPCIQSEQLNKFVSSKQKNSPEIAQANLVHKSNSNNIVESVIQRLQKPKVTKTSDTPLAKDIHHTQDMQHSNQEEIDTKTKETPGQRSMKQGEFYGLSLNESITFFTPSYQRPKEIVDFPNFDLFQKSDMLCSDDDYDSSILRGLKKSFRTAQQMILEEGVQLDTTKSDLAETSSKHAEIIRKEKEAYTTNKEIEELNEIIQTAEDEGRLIQIIFNSDIEEKFYHLVTRNIVKSERG